MDLSKIFLGKLPVHFAENVSVVGLKDAVTYRHTVIRIIWVLLLLCGTGATAYYMYNIILEYLKNSTATKVCDFILTFLVFGSFDLVAII